MGFNSMGEMDVSFNSAVRIQIRFIVLLEKFNSMGKIMFHLIVLLKYK